MVLSDRQKEVLKAVKRHGGNCSQAAEDLGISRQGVSKTIRNIESRRILSPESKTILFMSDMHAPYHHRDTLNFYRAIKSEFDITEVKNVGDIVDNHMMSYHEYETAALGPREEYLEAKRVLQELEKLFPEMVISMGNHCSLNVRKAKTAGIPLDFLKDPNDIYELGGGWKWVDDELFDLGNGQKCYLTHTISANTRVNAYKFSHPTVQGHHHGEFCISYYADQLNLNWAMSVGCTIDHKAPAMNYAASNRNKKPIIGCGMTIDGFPHLIPMRQSKGGGWDGTITLA